jgi:hypothetical protein
MNKLTIILNCIIHIILVLIFEGIFLFGVLYPILNTLSNRYLASINNYIYSILYPDDYYNLNYYINYLNHFHCYSKYDKCCKTHKCKKHLMIDPVYQNLIENTNKDSNLKTFNNNINTNTNNITLFNNGYIKEQDYLSTQKNKPYMVYFIIQGCLVIFAIILIIISFYMNININYKFIMINSIIIFFVICMYAAAILWLDVFSQDYVLNIEKGIYQSFYDVFNEAN